MNNSILDNRFSSDVAESYADMVSKKQNEEVKKRANSLIKYIESKYEKRIKKAIERDKSCRQIRINLPFFKRINNKDILNSVQNLVRDHFNDLGFRSYIVIDKLCGCAFDPFCNREKFYIQLNW